MHRLYSHSHIALMSLLALLALAVEMTATPEESRPIAGWVGVEDGQDSL